MMFSRPYTYSLLFPLHSKGDSVITRRIVSALMTLFVTIVSASAISEESQKITVVVDEAYSPYMYKSSEGAKGLYPDLVRAVLTRAGVSVEIKALPWARAVLMGEKGEAGVGGIYKNLKRLETFDYSDSLFDEHMVVYVRKGNAFSFNGLDDLKGKQVGVNRGWSYGEAFDKAKADGIFKANDAADNVANFKKLIFGRIDCFVADELSALMIIRNHDLANQVERLANPLAVTPAYVVFAKETGRKNLIDKFNVVLTEMKQDGSYQKLVEKFIAETGD
jgi:polar amino acid transport system substrate-binding protein